MYESVILFDFINSVWNLDKELNTFFCVGYICAKIPSRDLSQYKPSDLPNMAASRQNGWHHWQPPPPTPSKKNSHFRTSTQNSENMTIISGYIKKIYHGPMLYIEQIPVLFWLNLSKWAQSKADIRKRSTTFFFCASVKVWRLYRRFVMEKGLGGLIHCYS